MTEWEGVQTPVCCLQDIISSNTGTGCAEINAPQTGVSRKDAHLNPRQPKNLMQGLAGLFLIALLGLLEGKPGLSLVAMLLGLQNENI